MTDKDPYPDHATGPAETGGLPQAVLSPEQLAALSPAELRRMLHDLQLLNAEQSVRVAQITLIATERKRAEESLRDREKLLRAITDGSDDMIFI